MDIDYVKAKLDKMRVIYSHTKESKIRQSIELIMWQQMQVLAVESLLIQLYIDKAMLTIENQTKS